MMSNSNYSIGLQRLKPVDTVYGAICMPIRKLLMHWHHSNTTWSWARDINGRDQTSASRDRDVNSFCRDETRRWYISWPRRRDRDHNPVFQTIFIAQVQSHKGYGRSSLGSSLGCQLVINSTIILAIS